MVEVEDAGAAARAEAHARRVQEPRRDRGGARGGADVERADAPRGRPGQFDRARDDAATVSDRQVGIGVAAGGAVAERQRELAGAGVVPDAAGSRDGGPGAVVQADDGAFALDPAARFDPQPVRIAEPARAANEQAARHAPARPRVAHDDAAVRGSQVRDGRVGALHAAAVPDQQRARRTGADGQVPGIDPGGPRAAHRDRAGARGAPPGTPADPAQGVLDARTAGDVEASGTAVADDQLAVHDPG